MLDMLGGGGAPRDLGPEMVIDSFAGGGGASTGIRLALGRDPDAALNHDPVALAIHEANHPGSVHYCQDIFSVEPNHVTGGRPVGLLWASPDCTHFSKAKGGAPTRNAKIRDLAWAVVKWARQARPRVIILENVEEFQTWGPLNARGEIIKSRQGETFREWLRQLKRLGYKVEHRELRACDYGAPTIRKRFFLIARRDGRPIVWPEPTHGPGREQPYRTAADIIDWTIPCPSIFERSRPLAENTLRRIAEGIRRYVIETANPFIVNLTHGGRTEPGDQPLRTITTANRGEKAVAAPYLVKANHAYPHFRGNTVEEPLRTVTANEPGFALASPVMIQTGYGERPGQAPRALDINKPLGTVVAGGVKHALASPVLVGAGGPRYGGKPVPADRPMGTLLSENHHALAACLLKHYGGVVGQPADAPMGTVTTVDHHSVCAAHIMRQFGNSTGAAPTDPLGTVTAGGGGKSCLATSHLLKLRGTCKDGQPVTEPLPTLTAGRGYHVGEVRAFLVKYYGQGIGQRLTDPAATVTTKDRMGLVTVAGEDYVIADIGLRMLTPRELFDAQGFPPDYIIDLIYNGRPLPKSKQVRACGNSVCPPLAEALVRANCADMAFEVAA